MMDNDDLIPRATGDLLSRLVCQDLDPFSVDELHARIETLTAEIARVREKLDKAVNHRAGADALFKR